MPLTSTPLSFSELGLKLAIKAALIKVGRVVCRGHGLKAKVNTHELGAICGLRLDFADKMALPAAPGILREGARGKLAFDLALLPDAEAVTAHGDDAAPADLDVLVGKGHPSKGALGPLAHAPAQTGLALFAPPDDDLVAHRLNELGGQAALAARAFRQVAQLIFRGPAGPAFSRAFADFVAVVPNRVDLVAEPNKGLAAVRVLDTKAESLVELQLVFGFPWSKAWRPTALVKLLHATQIRSSRRLYATRALGLHDQATRKGAQQRAPSATGNDLPRPMRGLRRRAWRVQWRERSPPLARQLSAEARHIRVGQQPEGWAVSPAQAGLCQHQGILVGQKEQKSAIDPELFCGFGRTSAALPAQAIHRAANAAVVTSAVSAG